MISNLYYRTREAVLRKYDCSYLNTDDPHERKMCLIVRKVDYRNFIIAMGANIMELMKIRYWNTEYVYFVYYIDLITVTAIKS